MQHIPEQDTHPNEREAELFKAIGNPTRLGIVKALAIGERCVNEIAEEAGADVSTVSLHLTRLRHAGVVTREQRGKHVFYRLSSPKMAGMLRCISSGRCCGGCHLPDGLRPPETADAGLP